jgi:hypothetical protein
VVSINVSKDVMINFSALDICDFDKAMCRSLWGKFQTHPEFFTLKMIPLLSFKTLQYLPVYKV